MQPQRKLTIILIFIFAAISIFLVAAKNLLANWGIDNNLLLSGNGILFIISMAVFFIQRKALSHSNPNVFLRSVMAGMMIKMFTCATAVVIYFLVSGKDFNSTAVLIFMGLYIIYLIAEVGAIMKLNKNQMPKQEAPLQQLKTYLPEGSFDEVLYYLQHYKVQLTVTRERKSVLGDYRNSHADKNHRISVNGNLNQYSFLITLLHELAHLFTYERFGHRVQSHGAEWKNEYSKILAQFLLKKIFPDDIYKALLKSMQNPAASSCADDSLLRVLHKYDPKKEGFSLIETLPTGTLFKIKGGRIFKKEEKIRKRIRCVEVKTGKVYLFSPVYEVMLM